jgi:hypothetical protein
MYFSEVKNSVIFLGFDFMKYFSSFLFIERLKFKGHNWQLGKIQILRKERKNIGIQCEKRKKKWKEREEKLVIDVAPKRNNLHAPPLMKTPIKSLPETSWKSEDCIWRLKDTTHAITLRQVLLHVDTFSLHARYFFPTSFY